MNLAIPTSSCVGTDPLPALYVEDESQSVEMDTRPRTPRLAPITDAKQMLVATAASRAPHQLPRLS
jgi:hypothetical protein